MVRLADARRVIAAAEKKAQEMKQPMNIAVVDEGGNLVSHVRMDGAWIGSIDISINKAFTARAFDITTAQLSENSQPGQQFYGIQNSNNGRIIESHNSRNSATCTVMKRRRAAISVHSLSLLAREAVIGAIEANDLAIRRLMK